MNGAPKLDRLDIRILSYLQRNGRISNVNLADEVGLSPSPCLTRVKRLEKAGYIIDYGAHIQLEKLGTIQRVFTQITLKDHRPDHFAQFEAYIRKVDEVQECHLVSGGFDYQLIFLTRNVVHYQEVMESLLDQNIFIDKYFSYIVIKSPIVKKYYPIDNLFNPED
jgi:DNA-binding Lrp family transcriptional regulator